MLSRIPSRAKFATESQFLRPYERCAIGEAGRNRQEFLGEGPGTTFLQKRGSRRTLASSHFLPILLLNKIERHWDEGQEEQHNGRPAQDSAAAVERRIRVEGRGMSQSEEQSQNPEH